jgi:hypothetical protein
VETIVSEAKKRKSQESISMINSMIDQKTSMLYIDEFFMAKRSE